MRRMGWGGRKQIGMEESGFGIGNSHWTNPFQGSDPSAEVHVGPLWIDLSVPQRLTQVRKQWVAYPDLWSSPPHTHPECSVSYFGVVHQWEEKHRVELLYVHCMCEKSPKFMYISVQLTLSHLLMEERKLILMLYYYSFIKIMEEHIKHLGSYERISVGHCDFSNVGWFAYLTMQELQQILSLAPLEYRKSVTRMVHKHKRFQSPDNLFSQTEVGFTNKVANISQKSTSFPPFS